LITVRKAIVDKQIEANDKIDYPSKNGKMKMAQKTLPARFCRGKELSLDPKIKTQRTSKHSN